MKRLGSLVLVGLLAFALAGCATLNRDEPVRLKCPACGHGFGLPKEGR